MNERIVLIRMEETGEWIQLYPNGDGWSPPSPTAMLSQALDSIYPDWKILRDGFLEASKESYEIDLRYPSDDRLSRTAGRRAITGISR